MKAEYNKILDRVFYNLDMENAAAKDLLQLWFKSEVTPAELSDFYSKYDFEELGYQCVWLLVKLSAQLHYEGVPKHLMPRVKGVLRKFAVENGQCLCELAGILNACNKENIDVLLLKGAAMKAFYEPAETRFMGDVDFLVRPEDVDRAWRILQQNGFKLESFCSHHISCKKRDVLFELHRVCVHENILTGDSQSIWDTAIETQWQGKRVLVPCPEVMLMILLVHIVEDAGSIYFKNSVGSSIKWLIDARFFIDKYSIDWQRFIKIVKENDFCMSCHIMLEILNRLYPGTVPDEVVDALPVTEKDLENQRKLERYAKVWNTMMEAKEAGDRMRYLFYGVGCMWYRNCFYGKRDSLLGDIVGFPHFVNVWNGRRGFAGIFRFAKDKWNSVK